jgi:hypothetical protein
MRSPGPLCEVLQPGAVFHRGLHGHSIRPFALAELGSGSPSIRPRAAQPNADHPGYLVKQGSSTGHGWSYTMSPTIAECLEHLRGC